MVIINLLIAIIPQLIQQIHLEQDLHGFETMEMVLLVILIPEPAHLFISRRIKLQLHFLAIHMLQVHTLVLSLVLQFIAFHAAV